MRCLYRRVFKILKNFDYVVESDGHFENLLIEDTCGGEKFCFGACEEPQPVCEMQCPRDGGKCELVCETPPPPECCGNMECHCKEGYSRYFDHTGVYHRTPHSVPFIHI